MKCKRCGEPLDPRDTHCPICGRAVSGKKKAPAPKKNDGNVVKLPQLDKFTHAYAQDTFRSNLLQLLTIAAVAVAIVLAALVYSGVGSLRDAVHQLQLTADAQLQQSQQQPTLPDTTEPEIEETAPPTDAPTEPEVLPLGQQALTAALSLYRTDTGAYASAVMNPAYAAPWVSTLRDGSQISAVWSIRGTGDRLALTLREDYGSEEALATLELTWTLTGQTFAAYTGTVCAWEYRIPGGEWEPLPGDPAATDMTTGASRLALTADSLTTLSGQQGSMELRCQLVLTNADGGSLRVITDGITLGPDGPVAAGSLPD